MAKRQEHLDYTPDFLAFWLLYPQQNSNGRWVKPGKWPAFLVWLDMSDEDKKHAFYSVKFYRECVKDGRFVQHARTWLHPNNRGYMDWDMPEEKGQHLPASMTTNALKSIPKKPDLNDARNKAMAGLKEKL
jgi:hypothetical protein